MVENSGFDVVIFDDFCHTFRYVNTFTLDGHIALSEFDRYQNCCP